MKAVIKQVAGLSFVGKSDSNHWVPMDASPSAGGSGAGSSPMELMLLGIGGCTGVDVVLIMKKRKKMIRDFEVEVEATRAESHPKVFTRIHIIYKFWGENLEESEIQRAIDLSESKYCSASAMIGKTAKITHEYQLNPPKR